MLHDVSPWGWIHTRSVGGCGERHDSTMALMAPLILFDIFPPSFQWQSKRICRTWTYLDHLGPSWEKLHSRHHEPWWWPARGGWGNGLFLCCLGVSWCLMVPHGALIPYNIKPNRSTRNVQNYWELSEFIWILFCGFVVFCVLKKKTDPEQVSWSIQIQNKSDREFHIEFHHISSKHGIIWKHRSDLAEDAEVFEVRLLGGHLGAWCSVMVPGEQSQWHHQGGAVECGA